MSFVWWWWDVYVWVYNKKEGVYVHYYLDYISCLSVIAYVWLCVSVCVYVSYIEYILIICYVYLTTIQRISLSNRVVKVYLLIIRSVY